MLEVGVRARVGVGARDVYVKWCCATIALAVTAALLATATASPATLNATPGRTDGCVVLRRTRHTFVYIKPNICKSKF